MVRNGAIRIVPERFAKVYFNWMENIRDWPISRQLWWGHRIPIYYCDAPGCTEEWASVAEPGACPACGGSAFHQEEDVLDTWFSSGLWPLSTLGWPNDTDDLRTFYPTSVMETGYDILFFWVARMIMFGLEFGGDVPFHTVYLHGLVKAASGQKMSKTKGNVQDPLELIDLYGTDALRMAVVIGNTPGNDFTLTPGNLEARRDFVNKLWNVGRFVTASTSADERRDSAEPARLAHGAHLADRWIVSRLERTIAGATRLMSEYNFGEAGRVVHDFVWDEFADWYLEAHKLLARRAATDGQLLARVYEKLLRLLHPLTPFVTEELWQRLGTENAPVSVGLAPWPTGSGLIDPEAETQWADLTAVVRAARALRADYRIESTRWVEAYVVAGTPERASFWREQADLLGNLPGTRLRPIEVLEASSAPAELAERSISAVAGGVELLLPAAGLFDVGAEEARARTELGEAEKQIERLHGLLSRPGFAEQAPAEVVDRERGRLAEQQERRQALARRVETLERLGAGG